MITLEKLQHYSFHALADQTDHQVNYVNIFWSHLVVAGNADEAGGGLNAVSECRPTKYEKTRKYMHRLDAVKERD